MSDWRFSRKGTACAVCSREFAPGETFVSAIYEREPGDEEGEFERIDACPACFGKEEREPFSRWVTRRPAETPAQPILDLGMARDFLVRLAREGDPERRNLLFILSLLLMRKRQVKVLEQRGEEEGGPPVMEIAVKGREDDPIVVPVVTPDEEETAEIEAELGRLFGLTPASDDQSA